ncbi:MAG: 4Fe-4S binding protein [Promethearchaeia archaeon]
MVSKKKWEIDDLCVLIDLDKCVGSAECVDVCPVECYELIDGKVDAENIGECIECMACEGVCPTEAILEHSSWSE